MKNNSLHITFLFICAVLFSQEKAAPILGHGALRYSVDLNWAKADPKLAPVIVSQARSEDKAGRRYLSKWT
ncbi:MAG: hypothetical protein NTX20_03270 [Verrucomicrobia bacterium]|nr:hypothetical protein [Verrucomicrobiota bacterium]